MDSTTRNERRELKDFPVETNGEALVEAIRMIPGESIWPWQASGHGRMTSECLSDEKSIPRVDELIVAGITQSRGSKSDERAAYGLAGKLRVGNPDKSVFKSLRPFGMLRELSRFHMARLADLV